MKTTEKELDTHSIDVRVGERIREIRKSKGMTQKDLAKHIGVKFQQVQKYECALNRVSASKLWMIAELLEVKVRDLFGEELMQRLEGKRNQGKVRGRKRAEQVS